MDDEDFVEALALCRENGARGPDQLAYLGIARQSQAHTATQTGKPSPRRWLHDEHCR